MEEYYLVDGQKKKIAQEKWDFLIILDACRYDYFEKAYRKYLKEGELHKAISPAIHTMDWLNAAFPGKYDDIVYLSTNPYVNSKTEVQNTIGYSYKGSDHFFKIIDIWETGWNDVVGSVLPEEVNRAFFDVLDKYGDKRFVLHFIQPHKPFVGGHYQKYYEDLPKAYSEFRRQDVKLRKRKKTFKRTLKTFVTNLIIKYLGMGTMCKISILIRGAPQSPEVAIWASEGKKGYLNAYKENLNHVLEMVGELVEKVDGRYLITADHGEFLGEYGYYGHPDNIRKRENTEVPWMIIDKGDRKRAEKAQAPGIAGAPMKPSTQEDEEKVKEKLRSLGYF